MKKIYLIFLTLALVLGLCSCVNVPPPAPPSSPAPEVSTPVPPETSAPEITPPVVEPSAPFTAPNGTVASGVKLDGMTREDALHALQQAAAEYTLELKVGETELSVSGQSVELAVDEALFDTYWTALESGDPTSHGVFVLNSAALESFLSGSLEYSAKNPAVVYSKSQESFVVTPGSNGLDYDIPSMATWVASAMCSLTASSHFDGVGSEVAPAVSNSDPLLIAAVEKANSYLDLVLVYSFITEDGGTISETFLKNTVAPMIQVSNNYSVSISRSAVESQVAAVAKRHSSGRTGNFVTTGGQTLSYTVSYYDRQVDVAAMTEDLYTCLTTGVSGQRIAPYLSVEQTSLPYGGSYVEIDLSNQILWVYKDGQRVVTTFIVSGCVAEGNMTPTGVFSIYKKAEDAWLAGPTWLDHVDYWMPFYGAYGLHDASWRDEFGEDIYIHEGSHGCPNLPVEIAGQVYHNVSVGTPVIIYGGLKEPVDLKQELGGLIAYYLSPDETSFKLDYSLRYDEAKVTFTSSNPDVVTVDTDGNVTVHGPGKANITIYAAAFTYHTDASMTVSVSVPCPADSHSYGEWAETTTPSCENAGTNFRTCSVCGNIETQEIPAAGHDFTDSSELCANGCGTVNPDFISGQQF